MATVKSHFDWKSLYAGDVFQWQRTVIEGKHLQFRRLGIVENLFDSDGTDYEGRADLNMRTTIEMKTDLTDDQLQHRIVLAWACMRGQHPLLASKSLYGEDFLPESRGRLWIDKYFVYEKPASQQQSIDWAHQHSIFVQNSYPETELDDFYIHLMNTGRAIDAKEALSRLFVMPFQRTASGNIMVSIVTVAAHEIADGLTTFRLSNGFIDLLNMNEQDLLHHIDVLCSEGGDPKVLLPAAQESLYPVYAKSIARDRWNWAITRILRHVRRPPPASFQNPLRRDAPLQTATKLPEKYPQVLNYAKLPPLNGFAIAADLSPRATQNLVKLCRQAGISIGSGAFTLVGIVMMRFEEARHAGVPHWERLPFVGSFPVNPRPFLSGPSTTGKEDSLMLAFSDGITLPFIPSNFDLAKTFRVLGRVAHRQLRQYQKRKRTAAEEAHLGSRSPRELLPALYLSTLERLEWKVKPEQRLGLSAQTAYPAKQSPTQATCGISSVGDRTSLIASGRHDLNAGTNDLMADFRDLRSAVRPRDGEFLVGAIGTKESMQFRVSYDGCAIDPKKAEAWKQAMETILDYDMDTQTSEIATTPSALARHAKL